MRPLRQSFGYYMNNWDIFCNFVGQYPWTENDREKDRGVENGGKNSFPLGTIVITSSVDRWNLQIHISLEFIFFFERRGSV